MLKIRHDPTLEVRANITVPGGETAAITLTCKYLGRAALQEFYDAYREQTDRAALGHLIQDWDGVDGPYTPDNLTLLLDSYPAAAGEILAAYTRTLVESRAKN